MTFRIHPKNDSLVHCIFIELFGGASKFGWRTSWWSLDGISAELCVDFSGEFDLKLVPTITDRNPHGILLQMSPLKEGSWWFSKTALRGGTLPMMIGISLSTLEVAFCEASVCP